MNHRFQPVQQAFAHMFFATHRSDFDVENASEAAFRAEAGQRPAQNIPVPAEVFSDIVLLSKEAALLL